MQKKAFRSLEKQRIRWGWVFLAPWIVGIAIFFLWPMIQTIIYSFSKFGKGFDTTFVGFQNYMDFFGDALFLQNLLTAVVETLPSALLIIVFSTMIALLLRQEFPMRGLARAVFFLPVIIASGPVISILQEQVMMGGSAVAGAAAETGASYMFQAPDLTLVFADLGVPEQVLESIKETADRIGSAKIGGTN